MFSLRSLTSIRPFAESCHCCLKVPGQDCSPKPHKASEGGKQKADGYSRAESLPERAGPWLPWQHRAQQALQGALGLSELICAGDPQQGTEQMNQSLDRTSQGPDMALHQLQVPAFWNPGSCSNYCCQAADPQPTVIGTYSKVQDVE